MIPGTIAELPFARRPPLELLGLTHDRPTVDHDYTGFGWTHVDRVWLDDGRAVTAVDDALILALHSADDGAASATDIELEFALDRHRLVAPLSRFLERWLPRLPATAAVVLALCNPHRAAVAAPDGLGRRRLWYGHGPVDSWLDDLDREQRLRLVADAGWFTTHLREAP